MASEVFQLYLLLTLKDYASGGLNHIQAELRATGKEGAAVLRTFEELRAGMSKGLQMAGVGVGGLMLMRKGVEEAASLEDAMTEMRLSIERVGPDGAKNIGLLNDQMARGEALAVKLGNRLPMTTESAVQMLTKLRQGGLDFEKVLGGAGETVAKLAILTHEDPAGMALDFARFAQEFKLTADETKGAANVFLKGYRTVGLTPTELMETFKYFQTRVGSALGLTGVQGAQTAVNLMTLLARHGITGHMAGTETAEFFGKLAAPTPQMLKELAAVKKEYGVTLDFYKGGKFLGIDNAIAQMGKLSVLTQQQQLKAFKIIGGERAMGLGSAFMGGQKEWQAVIEDAKQIPDVEAQMTEKIEDFNVKLMNVETTLKNIMARGFTPMLEELKPILETSNDIAGAVSDWLKQNPEIAKMGGDIFGVSMIALTLVGVLKAGTNAWGLYTLASGAATRALQGEAVAATEAGVATSAVNSRLLALKNMSAMRLMVTIAAAYVGFEVIEWLRGKVAEYEKEIADAKVNAGKIGAERAALRQGPPLMDTQRALSEKTREQAIEQWKSFQFGGPEVLPFLGNETIGRWLGGTHPIRNMPTEDYLRMPAGVERRPKMIEELRQMGGGALMNDRPLLAALLNAGKQGNLPGVWTPKEQQSFQSTVKEAVGDQRFAEALKLLATQSEETAKEEQKTSEAFKPVQDMLTIKFPGSLQTGAQAVERFADRLNLATINPTPGASPSPTPAPTPGRALGGRVLRGVDYIGGERGMELFTPDQDGWVTPNNQLRLMRAKPVAVAMGQGTSQVIHHHHHTSVTVNVPPGSRAADDPDELAGLVAYALERQRERA